MTASPAKRQAKNVDASETEPAAAKRRRDAAQTRRLLLAAARRRFAAGGYAATTVRDIADDVGVNVALINRYFGSKEGLFEACLSTAIDELRRTTGDVPLEQLPAVMTSQLAGYTPGGSPNDLALLLRSSGDERADEIRVGVLASSAERVASAVGWRPDSPDDRQLILRAQVVIAAGIGIALLRSSTRLQPLASASEQDLFEPLRDLVGSVLSASGSRT